MSLRIFHVLFIALSIALSAMVAGWGIQQYLTLGDKGGLVLAGVFFVIGMALALLPRAAAACSVCLGDPDSQMAVGVNNGILVLLGCVAFVQVGFFALFWSFRNRAKRLQQRRERFSLIEGGAK